MVNADSRDSRGWTPLIHAAIGGHADAQLLPGAARAQRPGATPLMAAASTGKAEVVAGLPASASCEHATAMGRAGFAAAGGNLNPVATGREGADCENRQERGYTPLMLATAPATSSSSPICSARTEKTTPAAAWLTARSLTVERSNTAIVQPRRAPPRPAGTRSPGGAARPARRRSRMRTDATTSAL